jgi:hypothetical protein
MQWSLGAHGKQCTVLLCLIGSMLGSACGSGGGDAGSGSSAAGNDSSDDGSSEQASDAPGNLPNLNTDPTDVRDPQPESEPADCEVLTLTPCVTEALDELTQCLAAGHGGSFSADRSRCELPEADAVLTFSQAVPRWSTAFALGFVLEVAGQKCASYGERADTQGGIPAVIDLVTAQHTVKLETASDLQRTLTCDGTTVRFRQSNLSQCRSSAAMPTPELTDQTLDGTYSVSPMLQSNTRVFNCGFVSN